ERNGAQRRIDMPRVSRVFCLLTLVCAACAGPGCATVPTVPEMRQVARGNEEIPPAETGPGTPEPCGGPEAPGDRKSPRTLLKWARAGEDDVGDEQSGEDEVPFASDRPDFTEASSTVGRGRIQV